MSKRRTNSKGYISFDESDTPTAQPSSIPFQYHSLSRQQPLNQSFQQHGAPSPKHVRDSPTSPPGGEQQQQRQQHPKYAPSFFPQGLSPMGQSNPYGRDFSGQPMSTTSVDNLVPASPNATQSGASQSTRQDYSPLSEGWASKYNILGHHQYLDMDDDDPDDKLHDMNAKEEGFADSGCTWLSLRGFLNVLGMLLIVAALVGLFVGYPLYTYIEEAARDSGARGWNVGGTNSSGQVPEIKNFPSLVDKDTPENVKTKTGYDGQDYVLVFSDEFNVDGRTFFEGDDPFWEAVDFHYWATDDIEWYDPGQVTTADGSLVITMSEEPTHGMSFRSGMLQSWQKFCFTGGIIEISARLPGSPRVSGLWPGAWTLGNLGRAGYGATTYGTWPYSYDSCDIGTRANQTYEDQSGPDAALTSGEEPANRLSFLPGQRTSACTCKGEDHPGPRHDKGRAAPEIDIIEAEIKWNVSMGGFTGAVSQSAQFAPFNAGYHWNQDYPASQLHSPTVVFNEYEGGVFQQAASAQAYTDSRTYELTDGEFSVYGFEWEPGIDDDAHVTWITNGTRSWTMTADSIGADADAEISRRVISEEPHYIILNLGMSDGFQPVSFGELQFPATYLIDYVRVYQRKGQFNLGCSPKDMPTEDYINDHINAYTNPNLTTWEAAGYSFPRSSMDEGGC